MFDIDTLRKDDAGSVALTQEGRRLCRASGFKRTCIFANIFDDINVLTSGTTSPDGGRGGAPSRWFASFFLFLAVAFAGAT